MLFPDVLFNAQNKVFGGKFLIMICIDMFDTNSILFFNEVQATGRYKQQTWRGMKDEVEEGKKVR